MTTNKICRETFIRLSHEIEQQIVGQQALVQRLLLTLLCDGHLLLEGAPGLAKTRAIKTLASGLEADFHRIQFTPDLLPADLTGSDVFRPETGSFTFNKGPLFHNVILADEINRAPAKVQSALLEAMEERQITVGAASYPLPPLFLVMATQNPIEQEGTYPLPEAQLDRFLLHVRVDYPDKNASRKILQLVRQEALNSLDHQEAPVLTKVTQEQVFTARREIMQLHLAETIEEYIVEIIETTRNPAQYDQELSSWIRWGSSPRGAIAIERAARATAWLAERDFVTPEDVQKVTSDALRHRILLNYEAEADGITTQQCIDQILINVPAP
ncbi:MoxR-like ATPase [Nitrosomonas aestuarii]|uniref:MoxR-like ATPase n=1 Tax=Nitrosomonas aestuarii TaxID=52441 RepID=A0A1I4BI53_9PROT|nr:AAA family ATPase [Nitrosomonas aestuarii]SFK67990.1 MoxR-like ATPase [Nitrosomonas aestuarii]